MIIIDALDIQRLILMLPYGFGYYDNYIGQTTYRIRIAFQMYAFNQNCQMHRTKIIWRCIWICALKLRKGLHSAQFKKERRYFLQ